VLSQRHAERKRLEVNFDKQHYIHQYFDISAVQQQESSEKEKQYLRFILKIFLSHKSAWVYDNF
jgi:hypothetical protein